MFISDRVLEDSWGAFGIPILVRHLYIEKAPSTFSTHEDLYMENLSALLAL